MSEYFPLNNQINPTIHTHTFRKHIFCKLILGQSSRKSWWDVTNMYCDLVRRIYIYKWLVNLWRIYVFARNKDIFMCIVATGELFGTYIRVHYSFIRLLPGKFYWRKNWLIIRMDISITQSNLISSLCYKSILTKIYQAWFPLKYQWIFWTRAQNIICI